jgi:hypothetical protein
MKRFLRESLACQCIGADECGRIVRAHLEQSAAMPAGPTLADPSGGSSSRRTPGRRPTA